MLMSSDLQEKTTVITKTLMKDLTLKWDDYNDRIKAFIYSGITTRPHEEL